MTRRLGLLLLLTLHPLALMGAPTSARSFAGASWIWTKEGNARSSAPAGNRVFRVVFVLPDDYQREGAHLLVTADNLFAAYVNDAMVGENDPEPDSWHRPQRIDITDFLNPGPNCLAIDARNTITGPAGLLAKLVVFLGADQTQDVVSNGDWRCAVKSEPNWTAADFDDAKWSPAAVLGAIGVAPWGKLTPPERASYPPSFEGTSWIWTVNPDGSPDLAQATRYLRRWFELPNPLPKAGLQASLYMTADNCFEAAVNGKTVSRSGTDSGAWRRPVLCDVTAQLRAGRNLLAVRAENILPGAAGLLGKLRITGLPDGPLVVSTGEGWLAHLERQKTWREPKLDDKSWPAAKVLGPHGIAPWGRIERSVDLAAPVEKNYPRESKYADPIYRPGIVFVRGYVPLQGHGRDAFVVNIRGTRAYTEMDVPGPAALGTQLLSLVPCKPDGELRVLCDAAGGVLGSPSVSYDGSRVYFAMAKGGEPYFHLYVVNRDSGELRQLTDGAFHDFDPVELPDGRLAFSSTRGGTSEEYHGVPACAIYSCEADGKDVQAITSHIVFDREPRVTAAGSLAFLRSDNFLERAKVEVHVHETHLDGTAGTVIIGPGRKGLAYAGKSAAESNGRWLRQFGAGSPAPLPDGGVLALTQKGLVSSASVTGTPVGGGYLPYDMVALPDGRVLCTDLHRRRFCLLDLADDAVTEILRADELDLPELAPPSPPAGFVPDQVHGVQHLGARPRPVTRPSLVRHDPGKRGPQTGFLYCQNVRNTQQQGADASRIRAIRVYEGRPFSIVPTKSIYVHIGTEGVELGTVPVAEDGSFYAEVPADRAVSLQAVDGEGRPVISEMSWIYVRPGEFRSCVGCHAPPSSAPPTVRVRPSYSPPLALLGQGKPHRFRANNGANGGVLNLQLDRFREAAAINLFAASGPIGSRREDMALALRDMGEGSPEARIAAAQRLAILREKKAVPALLQAMSHASPEVRNAAVLALATCGDPHAIQPLRKAAADPHPVVAQGAKGALDHLTTAAVYADLATATAGERQQACEAWGHTGDAKARAALRRHLAEHPDDELRVLMAAMRALGQLGDAEAIPQLASILQANIVQTRMGAGHEEGKQQRPVYLAATAAEALGRIGTPDAEQVLRDIVPKLADFSIYTFNCGDHTWLMGCHSSVIHYRILEALDRLETAGTAALVPIFLRSIPIDKDRGLLYELDAYETLTARAIRRSGRCEATIETCLAQLGDPQAQAADDLIAAVATSPHAQGHIRRHEPAARAAQILSVVCHDPRFAGRIRARLAHFAAQPAGETRSWVCFFLARTLGQLQDRESLPLLRALLVQGKREADLGTNPPPDHWAFKAMKPFHRAAVAHALGQLGDRTVFPDLVRTLGDYANAPAVRRQAAVAVGRIGISQDLPVLRDLAQTYPELATRRCLQEAVRAITTK